MVLAYVVNQAENESKNSLDRFNQLRSKKLEKRTEYKLSIRKTKSKVQRNILERAEQTLSTNTASDKINE